MTVQHFVIALTVAAALLAVWLDARFPGIAPRRMLAAVVHVLSAILLSRVAVPGAVDLFVDLGSPMTGVFAIALPGLTYMFLSAYWVLKLVRDTLSGNPPY